MQSSSIAAARPSGVPRGDATRGDSERVVDVTSKQRSRLSSVATGVALLGAGVKGIVVDRPRLLAAFPRARADDKVVKWAAELVTGRITSDVVPISGGTVRAFGHTLTQTGWLRSYQMSNGLGLALGGVGLIYGIPNLVDGWQTGGGPEGLLQTRPGRTGVLASVAAALEVGLMGAALHRGHGTSGAVGRITSALRDPIHASNPVQAVRVLASLPVVINEAGYLDFLDEDDHRTASTAAGDTTNHLLDLARDKLPIV